MKGRAVKRERKIPSLSSSLGASPDVAQRLAASRTGEGVGVQPLPK